MPHFLLFNKFLSTFVVFSRYVFTKRVYIFTKRNKNAKAQLCLRV